MKKLKSAKWRRKQQTNLPAEIIGRLESLNKHRSLHEQRDTFTGIIKHPTGLYRWNSHLLSLPHYHIIETEAYGSLITLHVCDLKTHNILSMRLRNGLLDCHRMTPDDQISTVVPGRFRKTRWLCKPATTVQQRAVCRIVGIGEKAMPPLSAANANVVIQTHALSLYASSVQGLINSLLEQPVAEVA